MDAFDGLPDPIIVDILNKVGDVRTLLRCSILSKRFNSLVPETESLVLRLQPPESNSPITSLFRSISKTFHNLLSIFSKPAKPDPISPVIPSQILFRFDQIQNLIVEVPGDDEVGAAIKWRAEFGKSLKSCVVVTFGSAKTVSSSSSSSGVAVDVSGESDAEFVTGLKTRVVRTISALISASTRHYLMSKVVKDHEEMKRLVIRGGEGTVVMESEGLKEYRNTEAIVDHEKRVRSVVPSVRMSIRHAPSLMLKSGICLESATLVIVRPNGLENDGGDVELATEAFAGECMYGEAVVALLKRKKNVVEMNSF